MKLFHFVVRAFVVAAASVGHAQYAERPSLVGSGDVAVDASGRSIKNKRVRAIHSRNPRDRGSSGYFIAVDPFLAYQLGRNLNLREFRSRDGVFDSSVANLAATNPDGVTAKITKDNQTSCAGCHNLPNGNAGGGPNFHKDSGFGRNTPHYYGAGIVEMLAIQVRQEILNQCDSNGDGWISATECQSAPDPLLVEAVPGGQVLDYGSTRLDASGRPRLNNIFRVWYVDANGQVVPGASGVGDQGTVGFNFEMVVWGWGQGPGRAALNPTNRAFYWDPMTAHSGMDSFDPSTTNDPDGDGVSVPTIAGAIQFPATHRPSDAGAVLDPLGFSTDDPDGDGVLTEISEGDLDLAEWFMLNAPRPGYSGTGSQWTRGVNAMTAIGCTDCHVVDWEIRARDPQLGYAGDRRLFDFVVTRNPSTERLEGKLVPLFTTFGQGPRYRTRKGSFLVEGLFSDLKHHDMGPGFAETDFGGTVNTVWRTPPLWGVATSFPYGHDGRSFTLEDVIRRHGGEAQASKQAWLAAPSTARQDVLTLLRNLVLYDVESLPADIDGDGAIASHFMVAGRDTGFERFNAEWLFRTPVRIQGPVLNADGLPIVSYAVENVADAYGETLQMRVDTDSDGWPDVWDRDPLTPGYKSGDQ